MATVHSLPILDPLPGDPQQLTDAGDHYLSVAEQIRAVSSRLAILVGEEHSVGLSTDALRDQAQKVADAVGSALPRYVTTASAMKEYAVALVDAQTQANSAIVLLETTRAELVYLSDALDAAEEASARAFFSGAGPGAILAAQQDASYARWQVRERETTLDEAVQQYAAAEQARDDAAVKAATLITPVLGELNDSFFDKLGNVIDSVTEFVAMLDGWVAAVLEQVIQWLSDLVIVVLTLVFVAAAYLLYSIPALLGWMTWDEVLDAGIGATMLVLGALAPILVPALWFEVFSEAPTMRFTGVALGGTADDPYYGAFTEAHAVDVAGGADSTVVRIVRVGTDVDGRPIWRVVPPSTQDWELGSDSRAGNDLGSNLALMLAPNEQAAYERMILASMEAAGIGPEDPVMMVGFSQGGILAGKLAADPDTPFNIEAIVVAGSPIDAMAIPGTVSVLSIQHRGDPVHRLDGVAAPSPGSSWATITSPTWQGPTVPSSIPFLDPAVHDASEYAITAQRLADGSLVSGGYVTPEAQAAFDQVRADQAKFFSDTETYYTYEGSE